MNDDILHNLPPFLSELAPNAILSGTVMRHPVSGHARIRAVIGAVGTLYTSQQHLSHVTSDAHEFIEYEAELAGGQKVRAIVAVTRNREGQVTQVNVGHGPLDGALELSMRLHELLEAAEPGLFLGRK